MNKTNYQIRSVKVKNITYFGTEGVLPTKATGITPDMKRRERKPVDVRGIPPFGRILYFINLFRVNRKKSYSYSDGI
jgi:hypothetical protein